MNYKKTIKISLKTGFITILFALLFTTSCKTVSENISNESNIHEYRYKLAIEPADAEITINGVLSNGRMEFSTDQIELDITVSKEGYRSFTGNYRNVEMLNEQIIEIKLTKETYPVKISLINGNSEVWYNNTKLGLTPLNTILEYGPQRIILKRNGLPDQQCLIFVRHGMTDIVFEHKRQEMIIEQIGIFNTGRQPKQVIFSPDNKYIVMPLLSEHGFQVFDVESLSMSRYEKCPDITNSCGFAEGLFVPVDQRFYVSQMNTGQIYQYSYPDFNYQRTLDTNGVWSKFIAWSDELNIIAVSNWSSNNISIIDSYSGTIKQMISTSSAPRGMGFSSDSRYLYVATFEGGEIYKIDTSDWSIISRIRRSGAAMRHIVLSNDDKYIFVSDMCYGDILKIETESFTIVKRWKVDYNPNTIDLTPDNRFLITSSRGPNNPESYLLNSPRPGEITIIDLVTEEIVSKFYGGNQPTGLDISNDGRLLVFSNFRDNNIEIYNIEALYAK